MRAAEDAAREACKTLLVLDTVTGGDAERLYTRLGWQRSGVIPGYALLPGGRREGREPKADPMAKRTPGIPGPSACHEPFGT